MSIGLCCTPIYYPDESIIDDLNVPFFRSILYKLSDMDILLNLNKPLIITLNNQCEEVRYDWSGWDTTIYNLLQYLKRLNKLNQLLLLEAGNELDLYWSNDGSVTPLFGADLAIRTARIAHNYGIKVAATSLGGSRWPEYLDTMADICRNEIDFFSIHPYGKRPKRDFVSTINQVRDIGRKPVVVTEYGVKIRDAGSPENVAQILRDLPADLIEANINWCSWFAYSDTVGAPNEQGLDAFGLLTQQNKRRPAYDAYKEINGGNIIMPDELDKWRTLVGKGLLDMMKADNTIPAMASEWRPFDRSPNTAATIEQCIGLNGTIYMWHLPTNNSWRYRPN